MRDLSVNLPSTIRRARPPVTTTINRPSIRSRQVYRILRGEVAVDALVFEFMGLAMIALCVIVVAIPAARRASGRVREY